MRRESEGMYIIGDFYIKVIMGHGDVGLSGEVAGVVFSSAEVSAVTRACTLISLFHIWRRCP
jgi:hypothetical protein